MNQKTNNTRSGSGLIFAVVLLFVILGMVVTLSSVTMLETKMNQKTKSSVGAFYNADSGVEWALNKIATTTKSTIKDAFDTTTPGNGLSPTGLGADYKIYLLDQDGKVITSVLDADSNFRPLSDIKAVRAVGTQGGDTQRAIEAAVASGSCSDTPIEVKGNDPKTNDTGKKLIVVAYGSAVKEQTDLIGEMCGPVETCRGEDGSFLKTVVSDSSGTSEVGNRTSVTFIVPPGYTYRVRLRGFDTVITAWAWELCSK
jgi:hypothetical protein